MPIYMDVHNDVNGFDADAIAHAHQGTLELQARYGVTYLRSWYHEATERVFCLVEAPGKEEAAAVHRAVHGILPDEIIELRQSPWVTAEC